MLRQVDDFAISAPNDEVYNTFCDILDDNLRQPITRHGKFAHYNGLDMTQTKHYVTVNCSTFLNKILDQGGWNNLRTSQRLPMRSDNGHVRSLDKAIPPETVAEQEALQKQFFPYRKAIGELIWAMISCRSDISFPVVKLSQFSNNPAKEHYEAVKYLFRYVASTRDLGITYWRPQPIESMPNKPLSKQLEPIDDITHNVTKFDTFSGSTLYGYVDADWGTDIHHCRSVTGITFMLGGAAVAWKTRVQPTVSLSSSEAEFIAASDAGRMALWLCSILDEVGVQQQFATLIFEDNRGARLMANASQPTKNSRHIDIREFALLNWVDRDLLVFIEVHANLDAADVCTKQAPAILYF